MNDEINYKNNPLHGVGLKQLLTEIIDYYGFEILNAYLNINCFKTNPSLASSLKFLKKADWAREKVEAFYLYQYKNLPRASAEQFLLSPRDRIIPSDQQPAEPAKLSLEDAERLREKREQKSVQRNSGANAYSGRGQQVKPVEKSRYGANREASNSKKSNKPGNDSRADADIAVDPWAKWKKS